jgi:hypothetical protein
VQTQPKEDRIQTLNHVKFLDKRVDEFNDLSMEIGDKDVRRQLQEEVQKCKARTGSVISLLAQAST